MNETDLATQTEKLFSLDRTAETIATELGLECREGAVVLPGWYADDGNAKVEYPDAENGEEAARYYVDEGDWGDSRKTRWISVRVWRRGLRRDDDGGIEYVPLDEEFHSVTLEPLEPRCEHEDGHDWRRPHSLLGGLRENPGVWGHGGGVIIRDVCRHCGVFRVTDTWAQDPDTGAQGLTSVEYEDATKESRAWLSIETELPRR